jgi:hypothetical protein
MEIINVLTINVYIITGIIDNHYLQTNNELNTIIGSRE